MGVSFVFSVLSVRLIVTDHGLTTYATVALISTLVSLIPFADLGLGVALANIASEHMKGVHDAKLRPAVKSVVWTLIVVGATLVVVTVLLSNVLDLLADSAHLNHLGDPRLYLPLYSVLVAFWLVGGVANRLLMGMGRAATLMVLSGIGPILAFVGTWLVIVLAMPAWVLVLMPVVASVVVSGLGWIIVLRAIRRERPWVKTRVTRQSYRTLLRQGGHGLTLMLGTVLLLQSDRLVVSLQGSATDLIQIAIILPPFAAAQSLLGAAGAYLWPHYYGLTLEGQMRKQTLARHLKLSAVAGFGLAIIFSAMMPFYLKIVAYQGASMASITAAFAMFIVAQSCTLVPSSFLTSPDMVRLQGRVSLLAGLAKVLIAISLVPWIGAAGAVAASICVVLAGQLPTYLRAMHMTLRHLESHQSLRVP